MEETASPKSSSSSSSFKISPRIILYLSAILCLYFIWNQQHSLNKNDNINIENENNQNYVRHYHDDAPDLFVDRTERRSESTLTKNKNNNNTQHHKNTTTTATTEKITIAYAISFTGCPYRKLHKLMDAAAILRHSIHKSSIKSTSYTYQTYAIVHPQAIPCSNELSRIGYQVLIRDTPINITDIRGSFLRENIGKTGCCGEKELIKLWSYTLMHHPVVVHLDMDTLVLKPMDVLFDAMLNPSSIHPKMNKKNKKDSFDPYTQIPIMFNNPLPPTPIEAFYTKDYNYAHRHVQHVGMQGGFFVIRPNLTTFEEYRQILLQGDFVPHLGWGGGVGYGGFHGAQQIQGLMAYYYGHLYPEKAVELDRCYYNYMGQSPRDRPEDYDEEEDEKKLKRSNRKKKKKRKGKKRNNKEKKKIGQCVSRNEDYCDDCRKKPFRNVVLLHYTICYKPWACLYFGEDNHVIRDYCTDSNVRYDWCFDELTAKICNRYHRLWFEYRKDYEKTMMMMMAGEGKGKVAMADGQYAPDQFLGYCHKPGFEGYIPLLT